MKEMKRILAIFLCLVMLVGVMPVSAFATEDLGGFFIPGGDKAASEDGSLGGFVIPGGKVEAEETTAPAEEETTAPAEEETTAPSTEPATEPTVATEEVEEEEAEQLDAGETVYVMTGSDFQASSDSASAANVTNILGTIDNVYTTMNGFLFTGDLSQSMSTSASTSGKTALRNAVRAVYGSGMHEVYIQGNHDPDDTVGDVCNSTGNNDPSSGAYGVYVINEKDYPWGYYENNDTTYKNTVTATATALDTYLDAKVAENYSKPVFVLCHIPLHYTSRTNSQGDAKFAQILFDVLNEAGENGLNIIFLFGHNHSSGYDAYLGNAAVYLKKGDTITIADEGSKTSYHNETLAFTYMNSGYVGYVGGSADTTLTMSVFEITDSEVAVKRYDANGMHNLKAAGVTSSNNPTANTTVYGQAVINLSTGESTISEISDDTGSGDSGSGDSGSTGGSGNIYTLVDTIEDGQEYLIVSTNSGTGYALTNPGGSADGAAMGATSVTIENGTIVTDATDVIWTVTANGSRYNLTNGTDYLEGKSGDVAIYSTQQYADRGWNYEGNQLKHTGGNNTYIVYYDGGFTATYGSSSSTVYFFQRTGGTGGSTGGGSVSTSGDKWVTVTAPVEGTSTYTYKQATSITRNGEYVIVANDDSVALVANGTDMEAQDVTITGTSGSQTMTSTTELTEWTFSGTTSGTVYNGTNYLYSSSNGYTFRIDGSSDTLYFVDNGNDFTIKGSSSRTGYAFYYDGSDWATSGRSTAESVRLFQLTGSTPAGDGTPGLFAKITGNLEYTVARGASDEEALKLVKAGIKGYKYSGSAAPGNDVTGTEITEDLEFVLAENYDGSVPGEYAVTIKYNGVTLGVAKVTVPEATIVGYDCDESGTVIKGASKSAKTGAYITVDVKDDEGEDFTVPVTVGMLFNEDGTAVSTAETGTYTGLTVKYNGVVITDNFTLVVNPKNDNPTYPDEGAVKVNKTATGIDFQASGTATVELSASGIPMSEGIDVVIVLDTSSSMTRDTFPDQDGNEKTRIELLRPAVDSLIQQMQTKREDGSDPQIDIAIVGFNANTMATGDNYISDEGNDPSYDQTARYGILTKNSDGGAWVEIMDLDSDWGTQNSGANIPTGSGTNYDYGLQTAYDLLNQKKIDEGGARQQFVLFLSDGAPYQFNGVYSNGGESEWINWVLGNYTYTENEDGTVTTTIPNTVSNPEFYGGYANGAGQEHRIAEAIKGDVNSSFDVVKFDSSAKGYMTSVPGLGATIYTLGLLLADESNNITADNQDTVLRKIASSGADGAKLHYEVDSVTDLAGAFDDFATAVLLAATNARFTDEMGEKYNLQLTPVDYLPTGEETNYSTINPVLEIRSYEIYTRAELEEADGSLTEANAKLVGTRKTNADGSYKYQTLETITFQYTKNGTNNYTLDGATSDQLDSTNILRDGVICGKYFWYNTNKNANASDTSGDRTLDLDGDGAADDVLTAETFYWNIGDIKTTELALRYNVHLDGSLAGEGGREAGSYDTNGDAILYYDNYLGNPWQKEALTPSLAWEAANVSYAFYLVDASSGKPVNNDGVEVPFSNRTVIVDRTLYDEILLNNETGVIRPMSIAASGVLPAGYWLYDESATYTVTVNSNGTGNWVITGDSTLNNPASTYVKDYLGDEFTNENCDSSSHPDHDYTHTTVWFAVKWEPQAVPDTVVVDYGLPVDVHVLTNDMFGKYGKLIGVRSMEEGETTEPKKGDEFNTQEAQGVFGNAKLDVPATGYTEANSVITYTMETMGMNTFERFAYCVQYANPVENKNDGCYYGYLTVIPATTIYYEDDFVDLSSEKWENNGWVENGVSGWTIPEKQEITQDEDRPDDINYAFDTVIDANNVYGYDSAYAECSTYSLDQAAKATVDYDHRAKASFTFYGTGFDVISATNSDTGTIIVDVTDAATGESVHSYVVDTYYGYQRVENTSQTEENDSPWTFQLKRDASGLYQVPVIKVSGLTYGQYEVVITAQYSPAFDPDYDSSLSTEQNSYDFYLDAIRIYDPAGVVSGEDNDVIEDAYIKDNEAFPVYQELRNNILNKSDVDSGIPGAVFIDGIGETASVENYKEYGPNNEVYLNPGQAILFTTNLGSATDKLASLQIGLKAETQTAATYYIFDAATITGSADLQKLKPATVLTATDMYYDITALAGKNIVIYNSGDGILSITNLKATFTADSGLTEILDIVDDADIENFLNALNDGETGTGSDSGTGTNLAEVIKSIVGRLKGLFGNKG